MALKIKIGKETYPIAFGYGAFRIMGRKWGCAGINQTLQRLSILDALAVRVPEGASQEEIDALFEKKGLELTFDQEDVICDMMLAGIQLASPNIDLPDQEAVLISVFENPTIIAAAMEQLIESMPVQSGNVNPAKRAGAKKKK
ncbi:hypothetical protein [Terasakiella sp.]|uniref:hypothetical protein n=1 Tax=Terasakiella sp. TaxID=2034861 RepID=UPI003AA8B6E3